MRKIVSLISLLLICLVFTSCVDYVQSVTFKNGKYHMYYKVTLSKLLFAMADEDPEEIFMDFDKEEIGELPPNILIKPVNTELEVGAEFTFEIDPKTTDETEKLKLLQKIFYLIKLGLGTSRQFPQNSFNIKKTALFEVLITSRTAPLL